MTSTKLKFSWLPVLINLLFCGASQAADLFNNFSSLDPDINNAITSTQYLAMKVSNSTGAAFQVTSITLPLDLKGVNNSVNLSICPDASGKPANVGCSTFSNTNAAAFNLQNYVYTGSYIVAAGATLWVTAGTSNVNTGPGSPPNPIWYAAATTSSNQVTSADRGVTWVSFTDNELVAQLSGTANVGSNTPATASVPTLQSWGMASMVLMLGALFVAFGRKSRSQRWLA